MTLNDHLKLKAAGFTIIRRDLFRLAIKVFSGGHGWKTKEGGFKSKAALDRRAYELLEHAKCIED